MRGSDDREPLDALIDRVARDLTAAEPPATMAGEVRARVAAGGRARSVVQWRPVMAGAALMLAVVLAAVVWPERQADPPAVAGDEPAAGSGGSASSLDLASDAPGGSRWAANPPDVNQLGPSNVNQVPGPAPSGAGPAVRGGPAAQAERIAGAAAVATALLGPLEPLDVPAIDEPTPTGEMLALGATLDVALIEIEPLRIQPLE
jgi:hypothetical protein